MPWIDFMPGIEPKTYRVIVHSLNHHLQCDRPEPEHSYHPI
ncbi:hypothetical protein SPONN_809 [uncultured Candidatus Thioglobus sp.]|nr:hypothetical protein SPONN_809 [uncultured Candidatus Thioglobus sp.]